METEYFVFLFSPGPNWLEEKPIEEQPLQGHFQYMTELENQGTLILGGGFLDGTGAMGVLKLGNLEEAEAIVKKDPVVTDGLVTATIHPWFVTVGGSVEKS
jgi:hypothetical protein